MSQFYAEEYGTVHRAIYKLAAHSTLRYNQTREIVRRFLNAEHVEEIIFTRGTTDGINLVAASFSEAFIEKGDEILISAMEHHSNIVPWQLAAQKRGALLKVIPISDSGELILESIEKLLTPRTKILSLTHISNALGTINPIKEIIAMAHKNGTKVLIDGAQSAAHMPVDVQALDADFFVFSGHKAFGPTGVGVLYGKRELLEAMPPVQGGGDMVDTVTFAKTTYQPLPTKFESGTPMIVEVIGLGAALEFIESYGREEIQAYTHELLTCATEQLRQIDGLKIIGTAQEKGPIISFVLDGVHPLDLATLMDTKQIAMRTGHLCAQPLLLHFELKAVSRISFAPYNNKEEVDRFVTTLEMMKIALLR